MKVHVLDGAYVPARAHFDDAGIDFRSPDNFVLEAHSSCVVDFGVAVQIPVGYFGYMASKSGLMVNEGIVCAGGIIDSGFRGTIKVRMENHGDRPHVFKKGDKVTQMVLIPCLLADIEPVDELDPSESGRDASGWGSTGR